MEETMVKVYTTVPGAAVQIGTFGEATNETPAHVPLKVAYELAQDPGFRLEPRPVEPHAPPVTIDVDSVVEMVDPVWAWHSVNGTTYHDNRECNTGSSIEPENRREGTDERPLCKECAALNAKEEE